MRGPAATPCTPARRGRTRQDARDLNTANMADSYFHAQSEKVPKVASPGVLHGASRRVIWGRQPISDFIELFSNF
jgi:hypothetical protein